MDRLGIDLGGTKTECILLDGNLNVETRQRVRTPGNYCGIVDCIVELADAHRTADCSIGVCTPGVLQDGVMRQSNTACLNGMPLRSDLEQRLGRIKFENDANCFAMAEAHLGAGRGHGSVFGVIMGTGVGGGMVLDGRLYAGRGRMTGEWGHHTLHPGGRPCGCGRNGCAESYLSGPALERRWFEITGERTGLVDIAGRGEWRVEVLGDFALGIGNVISVLDPDVIILGGGVSNLEFLYTEGADAVRRETGRDTPILKNALGDSAGVFGAALL